MLSDHLPDVHKENIVILGEKKVDITSLEEPTFLDLGIRKHMLDCRYVQRMKMEQVTSNTEINMLRA